MYKEIKDQRVGRYGCELGEKILQWFDAIDVWTCIVYEVNMVVSDRKKLLKITTQLLFGLALFSENLISCHI